MLEFPSSPSNGQEWTDDNKIVWVCTSAIASGDSHDAWARQGVVSATGGNLPAVNTEINENAVVATFVYDTNLDDDGGAWVDRANNQSWFRELGKFPKVALIVAEANQLLIYDGAVDGSPLWMEFTTNAASTDMMGEVQSSVAAINGNIYVGNAHSLRRVDFINDRADSFRNTGAAALIGRYLGNISERNDAKNFTNVPTAELGTSMSSIHKVVASSDGRMNNYFYISTDSGLARVTVDNQVQEWRNEGVSHMILSLKIVGALLFWSSNTNSTQTRGVFVAKDNSLLDSDINSLPVFNTSYNSVWDGVGLPINNGLASYPSIKDFAKDTVATNQGITRIVQRLDSLVNSMICQITNSFVSGYMRGNIINAYLADASGTLSEMLIDRSFNADAALTQVGSPVIEPVAGGAELQALSGFTAGDYVKLADASLQEVGTGAFYVMGWVKTTDVLATIATRVRMTGDTTNNRWLINMAGGSLNFLTRQTVGSATIAADAPFNDGKWHHFCCYRKSGRLTMVIDGVQQSDSVADSNNLTNAEAEMFIGESGISSTPLINGSIALLRVGKGGPTDFQVIEAYEQERHMFEAGAKCTLQCGSNNVKSVDYDDKTGLLTVGTSLGLTKFDGLVVADSDVQSVPITYVSTTSGKDLIGT